MADGEPGELSEADWEDRVRADYRDLSVGPYSRAHGISFKKIHQIMRQVGELSKERPAPPPPSTASVLDDFVFTFEAKKGRQPTERWIGSIEPVADGNFADKYDAGHLDMQDPDDEDDQGLFTLRIYVTTPAMQTVKLYDGRIDPMTGDSVCGELYMCFEAHDLPYAHEKLEPFGLSMVPRLWGWVADLYLDFCAGEGEYTLRPADVLDYLRGQIVTEEV